jgi:hypothetical protein
MVARLVRSVGSGLCIAEAKLRSMRSKQWHGEVSEILNHFA